MHRLMSGSHMPRIDARGHWLDALAISRQHQARDVGAKRLAAVGVTAALRKKFEEGVEPLLL
jgi:hypothetical protein